MRRHLGHFLSQNHSTPPHAGIAGWLDIYSNRLHPGTLQFYFAVQSRHRGSVHRDLGIVVEWAIRRIKRLGRDVHHGSLLARHGRPDNREKVWYKTGIKTDAGN